MDIFNEWRQETSFTRELTVASTIIMGNLCRYGLVQVERRSFGYFQPDHVFQASQTCIDSFMPGKCSCVQLRCVHNGERGDKDEKALPRTITIHDEMLLVPMPWIV